MDQFLTGGIFTGMIIAALFFFRFWRETRDRLFALFSISFLLLGANRVALAIAADREVSGSNLYWIRFLAFAIILIAILDKNRSSSSLT